MRGCRPESPAGVYSTAQRRLGYPRQLAAAETLGPATGAANLNSRQRYPARPMDFREGSG